MNFRRVLVWAAVFALVTGCTKKKDTALTGRAAHPGRAESSRAPGDTIGRGPWRWIATVTLVERMACNNPDMYTLTFLPDSTTRVLIDCNRGSSKYHINGNAIRIGPIATTRMMCPTGSMDARFAQQIDAARTWFMQDDTLMLDLTADSGTMRLVR